MADNVDVIGYIKFQLSNLSSTNGHHDFENLCRHLARATICTNILPATGPVAAGGDQGRDFETFKTRLKLTPVTNSSFAEMASQKAIAFGCTIQKANIEPKIKEDIEKITSGRKTDGVIFFCASDIPIAKRHDLQVWADEKYSVDLEIFDGQAISELLAMRELFWIAQRFLGVPSEIYPRAHDETSWYSQSLERWQSKKVPDLTFADFYEIKLSIRHATFSDNIKQDLPFWIKLLRFFLENESPAEIRRKATYEIAVASLRGLGTLIGQEEQLREYLDGITEIDEIDGLEDAVNAVNYCKGASVRHLLNIPLSEIDHWYAIIIAKVDFMLKQANSASSKSPLLELRGLLSLTVDSIKIRQLNADEAIKWWIELTIVAKDAPLFPLERFADRLTKFTEYIGNHPKFEYLTQQTDLLLEERYGNIKAAEKCRDRAIAFYEKGYKLKAISQLHHAKVKWFNEETLGASVLSTLLISECYRELGLTFAGKYYALAGAHLCLNPNKPELKKLISRSIIRAADCEYSQGSWYGFLTLADLWLKTYSYYSDKTADDNHEMSHFIFETVSMSAITKILDSQLSKIVDDWIQNWNTDDWLKEPLLYAEDSWKNTKIDELWKIIQDQLIDRPFNDLGAFREARWFELGITWTARWANNSTTTPLAEQLIAILQILLADMADTDLCLLRSHITLEISLGTIAKPEVNFSSSTNKGQIWRVNLPKRTLTDNEIDELQNEVLTVAISLLAQSSLLPRESLFKHLEELFKNGISMKAFVVRSYEVLWAEFIGTDMELSQMQSLAPPQLDLPFEIKETQELSWINTPGPTYDSEKAKEYLKNRYELPIVPIKYTLTELLKTTDFKTTVTKLRDEGWLDWHILCCIANIAVNNRANQNPLAHANPFLFETLLRIEMQTPEISTTPVIPLSEFKEEEMRRQMDVMICSSLANYGLECRQRVPDFEAIMLFLKVRYRYFSDDLPHQDPFIFNM